MPVGRPTKYTPELLIAAQHYVDNWQDIDEVIPSIVGLALHIGINRDTAHDWNGQEGKDEFSDIFKKISAMQARELLKNGLNGEFNSTITKVMLTKHGFSDKVDNTLSGPNGGAIIVRNDPIDDEI